MLCKSSAVARSAGRRLVAGALLLAAALATVPRVLPAQRSERVGRDPGLQHLESELTRLAELARGTVGVAALHLESNRAVYVNRHEGFPMASTYKVPMAVEILTKVDAGQLRLDSMVTLRDTDIYRTASVISRNLDDPGVALSVRNLLELMLQESDNIATDIILRLAGGPAAVTARMRRAGVEGIRVDRPTWAIIANWAGAPDVSWDNPILPGPYLEVLRRERSDEERAANQRAFNRDPRDHATPNAMATLLTKIWRHEILSPESSELLIDIMYRCNTGEGRIKGILPPGTRVAHKTGTIGQTTNDVGIIALPGDAGHVVTVVYIKESKIPSPQDREPVIAQLARAIHDYFVFNPGEGKATDGQ